MKVNGFNILRKNSTFSCVVKETVLSLPVLPGEWYCCYLSLCCLVNDIVLTFCCIAKRMILFSPFVAFPSEWYCGIVLTFRRDAKWAILSPYLLFCYQVNDVILTFRCVAKWTMLSLPFIVSPSEQCYPHLLLCCQVNNVKLTFCSATKWTMLSSPFILLPSE